ncbi:hypothetical protein KQI65_08235 [bacterium]|nr:hypothetical protein [bacterium]
MYKPKNYAGEAEMQNACYISCMKTSVLMVVLLLGYVGTLRAQEDTQEMTRTVMYADSVHNAWHAVLADDDADRVFCVWSLRTSDSTRILGTMLHPFQREALHAVPLSTGKSCEQLRPAAAFLGGGGIIVAWQETCGTHSAIRMRLLDAQGRPAGGSIAVSDPCCNAVMPAAGSSGNGAVLTWQDYRNGAVDVYAQRIDAEGQRMGHALMVNDDSSRAMQGAPRVAADNGAHPLLIWPDNRVDGAWKFYAAVLQGDGVGTNLLVDSAQRKAMTTLPAALALPPDSALFAWKDYREGHSNIYLRSADLGSSSLSAATRLNDDSTDRWQRLVVLDSDGGERVVACWEDHRNTERNQKGDIYLQWLTRDGRSVGANQKVNTRDDRIPRKMPKVAMLRDGTLLVVWHQGDEGRFDLMGQWYAPSGSKAGEPFCITCEH